jgi:hypothetical protein
MSELSPDLALYLGQTYERARNEHIENLGVVVRQYQYESNLYKYDMIGKFGDAAGKYTTQMNADFDAEEARVKREHDEAIRLAEEDARIAAEEAARLAEEAARIALEESNMEKVKAAFKANKPSYAIYNADGVIITGSNIADRRDELIRAGGDVNFLFPRNNFADAWKIAPPNYKHYLYGYQAIKFGVVSLVQISAGQNDAAAAELIGKVEDPVVVEAPVVVDVIEPPQAVTTTTLSTYFRGQDNSAAAAELISSVEDIDD